MRPARPYLYGAALVALTACHDVPVEPPAIESPTTIEPTIVAAAAAEVQQSIAPLDAATARLEALRDALGRVVPALVPDDRATVLGTGLRQALDAFQRGDAPNAKRALKSVEQALQRYSLRTDAVMRPDLDQIRLAVFVASAP